MRDQLEAQRWIDDSVDETFFGQQGSRHWRSRPRDGQTSDTALGAPPDDPAGFLSYASAVRARAASSGDTSALDGIYEPANGALLAFEKERARYMRFGIGTAWDGTILDHRTQVKLDSLEFDGPRARCRYHEVTESRWIQNVRPVPPAMRAAYAREPARYASPVPKGPRGEISSWASLRHEAELVRGASGWRIARDEHDEFIYYGRSPDLRPGAWAAYYYGKSQDVRTGVPRTSDSRVPGLARPMPQHLIFDWAAAVSYARTYAKNYYHMYCNYNACGGDCANFVSQCLRQGQHPDAGLWGTFNGACGRCGTSAPYAGTDTWANNWMLRNFVVNQGRGVLYPTIDSLQSADLVNYRIHGWQEWHHITIVTHPAWDAGTLVAGHNPDVLDAHWRLGWSADHTFTHVYTNFHQ